MSESGYQAARRQSEGLERALRDVATLIGERQTEAEQLETGGEVVPGLGLVEEAEALRARAKDLGQGLFTIIVLGEFKHGKSTLLNSMLGSKVLPAKAAPATAIITVLVHGDREEVAVYETGQRDPRLIPWEQFVSEFQLSRDDQETLEGRGVVDRFRQVEYARVECRHPLCANGVRLVDSPGLGEHISRTRVATNFLKQAQAVIFVLNATRILTAEEREFIDTTLGKGRLPHVFFVVNRVNQVDPAALDEIRAWLEQGLAGHFIGEGGELDRDLYARRVFFVDAKGALEARSDGTREEERLAASGVPALEQELERFLTSEGRMNAVLQSTLNLLDPLRAAARDRMEQEKTALDQPLADLEGRRQDANRRLDGLQSRKHEIERTILLFAETVQNKVYGDLRAYIEEMNQTWPEDSRHLIDLDSTVSIPRILGSYVQSEARERMALAVAEQVQRYLQLKLEGWSERVPSVVERDVEMMMVEVEAQVEDFQLELDRIAALFAGTSKVARRPDAGAYLLQLALSLGDVGDVTERALGTADWGTIIARTAQQAVVVFLVALFLPWLNILLVGLLVEGIHLGLQENIIRKRLRESLGERLHEGLQEQVAEKKEFIIDSVAQAFRQLAASTTQIVQRQIDEVRADQDRIVRQKQDQRFSVEREKQRLDAIATHLDEIVDSLSHASHF